MTVTSSTSNVLAGLPQAPTALSRLLVVPRGPGASAALSELSSDARILSTFLRLSKVALPGRRFENVDEAVPLLGDDIAVRFGLLASGVPWLRSIVGEDAMVAPMLRHSIATAIAAESLARNRSHDDPLGVFALGLLHHLGDAARITVRRYGGAPPDIVERWVLGAAMLATAGAPDSLCEALRDYGRFTMDPSHVPAETAVLLGAADHAVTTCGYMAPTPCAQPATNASIMDLVAHLLESKRRLSRAMEEVVGPLVDQDRPGPAGDPEVRRSIALSPVVLPDVADGVSARDLGPLPVVFARIAAANDPESIVVAGTAGLVEEIGVPRAYFLHREDHGGLVGGVLCARGNAPMPLQELAYAPDEVPRAADLALTTGRPILHESLADGFEGLPSPSKAPTLFVPVVVAKETVGLIGVEVPDPSEVLPELMAAVAAHTGLALKAAQLQKLSAEAITDELTGLYNRRGILDVLTFHMDNLREGDDLAVALVDCDHLKKVNDNFGHLMGDEFVRRISEVLRHSLRTTDELGRYGGDEFLAVLPDANLAHVEQAMDRARARVEQAGLESEDGLLLSVSIGAAVRGKTDLSREKLLKLADYALYRAKEAGRNAVNVIDAERPPDLSL